MISNAGAAVSEMSHSGPRGRSLECVVMARRAVVVAAERIERAILVVRSGKVMLDTDLAALYGVPAKVLVQAITRNRARFPADFMF